MLNPFVIVSTRSVKSYAKRVVEHICREAEFVGMDEDIDYTDALQVDRFADGEMEVALNKSVRGRDVVVFTTEARNEAGVSLEEAKIELYHTVDVLQRSQARRIIVFEPFVSSSRSDRTTRRNSVGFWVHYKTLISLGMDHFITYQLHSDKSKTAVDPVLCDIDDIPATKLLKKYLCNQFIGNVDTLQTDVHNNWMFCSVDAGGEKLARRFASAFNTQLVIAHKQRSYTSVNTVESLNILSAEPLEGRVLWIVDDMIDTGGSICTLIKELARFKPKEINAAIVHPVFSNPAAARLSELKETGMLSNLVVCDTIHTDTIRGAIKDLRVVSSARLSAKVIRTIMLNQQMSDLNSNFSPEEYLKRPRLFGFAAEED